MSEDAGAYWVGPAGEPERYRLTHLLGSGGEGEVWRAVRAGSASDEVAVKINPVPAGEDDNQRLDQLIGIDIPGLVKVHEMFAGSVRHRLDDSVDSSTTHQYVVMDFVDGVTLRTWLDEHPDAPLNHRLRILRGIAHTLSELHRGRDGRSSVTHGDVKPTNVIIGKDGKPTLVDLGLLRPSGSGRASGHTVAYSSPELRMAEASPSPRADTFSFGVTAMETITSLTPPVGPDGSLDLETTRHRIANVPGLRLRPVLRRQLLRCLTVEPTTRPATPARVFVGQSVAVVLAAVLLLTGGGAALALDREPAATPVAVAAPEPTDSGSPTSTVAPPPAPTTAAKPSPTKATATPSTTPTPVPGNYLHGFFTGRTTSDVEGGCGPRAGNVVAPPGEERTAWGPQDFLLTLTANHNARILEVSQQPRPIRGPKLLAQDIGVDCAGNTVVSPPCGITPPKPKFRTETTYLADLFVKSLGEAPHADKRPFGVQKRGPCVEPSVLTLDANNCVGNYQYWLTLVYELEDQPGKIYTQQFGPLTLRARMTNGTFVTSLVPIAAKHSFTGVSTVACARGGLKPTVPYDSVLDEAQELLVQAVRERRVRTGLSRKDAIVQIAQEIDSGPYANVVTLGNLCSRASSESGWRTTCDPPGSSATPSPTP